MGKLTALKVKSLVAPGRYGDGGGLWLQVRDAQRRSWLFRYKLHGRAREMGLGPEADVTLAKARDAARECRGLVLAGIDPIEHRSVARATEAAKADAKTFREAADLYIAAHATSWRNDKHRAQWLSTLAAYVFPAFGKRPVAAVGTDDVMRALGPIWHAKPETASRVRGRIEAVLDYATARHWRTGENPARWRGHIANLLPKRSKLADVKHHAALPFTDAPAFMVALRAEIGASPRAMEFAILTAARTGEVLGARWAEIDMDAAVWTVPAARMKAKREHRVPLSGAAAAVLQKMRPEDGEPAEGAYVFPGAKHGKPLSNMALAMLLRRMERHTLTVHGFRSTFRDWAGETTAFPRELAEAALAHTLHDKVEAAYRRGDALAKRAAMMEAWAAFCGGTP